MKGRICIAHHLFLLFQAPLLLSSPRLLWSCKYELVLSRFRDFSAVCVALLYVLCIGDGCGKKVMSVRFLTVLLFTAQQMNRRHITIPFHFPLLPP